MEANILWTGIEYYSIENCFITEQDDSVRVDSTIVGMYEGKIYQVHYVIVTNSAWEVRSVVLDTQLNNKKSSRSYTTFDDCTDVDIPLTPFTNTLPIRRLKMEIGESREIKVLYLDILANEFKPVRQKYHRLSETEYRYENVPNDFEAVITVDNDGFVVDYPGLFKRTARQ